MAAHPLKNLSLVFQFCCKRMDDASMEGPNRAASILYIHKKSSFALPSKVLTPLSFCLFTQAWIRRRKMGCCERAKRENLREDVIKERRSLKEPQEAAARVFPPSLPWTQDDFDDELYTMYTSQSNMNTRQSPDDFDDIVCTVEGGGGGSKLKSSVSSHPPTRGRTSLTVHSLHRKEGSTALLDLVDKHTSRSTFRVLGYLSTY